MSAASSGHGSDIDATDLRLPGPDLVKIAAIIGTAGRDDREPARVETRREDLPAVGGPALVAEHRRRMDHRIGAIRRDAGPQQAARRDNLG